MIQIYSDLESLSRAAAGLWVEVAAGAIADSGRCSVVLAGGVTPRRTYELLAQPPYCRQVAWGLMHVFWGDERCVQSNDPRSNSRMARTALLNHVPIPPEQIHPIGCHNAPQDAATAYEARLRTFFAGQPPCFDLVFLGLGEDGHTASLFPGSDILTEGERWAAAVSGGHQGPERVTLTPLILNQARVIAFLVAGAAKASALQVVLEGPRSPRRLPAQLIHPEAGKLRWLVDTAAAQLLAPGEH